MFAELLRDGQAEEIVQLFVQRAMNGDAVALRVCFERLVAKPSAAPVQLDLAPGEESDPGAIVTAAIRGLADGEVSPQEAAAIARVALTAKKVLGDVATETRRAAAPAEEVPVEEGPVAEAAPAAAEEAPPEAAAPALAVAPVAAEADEAARVPAPVIRLFPEAAEIGPGMTKEAAEEMLRVLEAAQAAGREAAGAAASPVSGQFPTAPVRRGGGTIRGFIAARG